MSNDNMLKNITDENFTKEVLNSKIPVLVDFWAEWCGPCRMLTPILEEVAKEFNNKILVVKVNVDDNPNIPSKYGIRGLPTMIIFKDGNNIDSKTGAIPKSQIVEWINNNLEINQV